MRDEDARHGSITTRHGTITTQEGALVVVVAAMRRVGTTQTARSG